MKVVKINFDSELGFDVTWIDGRGHRRQSMVSSAERLLEEFGVRYETPSKAAGQMGSNEAKTAKSGVPGRPRKFRNAAARQKAYRTRKRASGGAA